jgi:hypothetical protein
VTWGGQVTSTQCECKSERDGGQCVNGARWEVWVSVRDWNGKEVAIKGRKRCCNVHVPGVLGALSALEGEDTVVSARRVITGKKHAESFRSRAAWELVNAVREAGGAVERAGKGRLRITGPHGMTLIEEPGPGQPARTRAIARETGLNLAGEK